MPNPMIRVHNIETNEIIDRKMTDDEFEQYQMNVSSIQSKKQSEELAILNKQSAMEKLTALGLTADEVAALIP
jgi:hypothetical protein